MHGFSTYARGRRGTPTDRRAAVSRVVVLLCAALCLLLSGDTAIASDLSTFYNAPAPRDVPEGRPDDPAGVVGSWNYRTRSNCGPNEGVGAVSFTWDAQAGGYHERGHVYWSHSGRTIRWWGLVYYDATRRRLDGRTQNTLGDSVDAHWELEGAGPDRLVVRWNQTNGCHGLGVATR